MCAKAFMSPVISEVTAGAALEPILIPSNQCVDPDVAFSPAAAHIDVDVPAGSFVDIIKTRALPGDDRLTTATWTLRAPTATVTQPGGTGTLVVRGASMIVFNLPAGSPYRFAGVAFKGVRGSGDATGHGNFPKHHIQLKERNDGSSSIFVQDVWGNHGPANTWNWDFYLIIQDEAGDIGIIDPDIENQD